MIQPVKYLFYLLIFFHYSLIGGQIHGILLIDTEAEDIGTSMGQNSLLIKDFLLEIAKYTGYPTKIVELVGVNLKAASIKKVLDELRIEKEDLVFFYYCGHGFRTSSKEDPWPYFYLSGENSYVDFDRIKHRLEEKNPRFLLAIADCCNNIVTFITPKSYMMPMGKGSHERKITNMRALFQSHPQWVVASSAIPGEIAWAYVGKGSVFTLAFLDVFHDEVKNHQNVSWEVIFERTREQIEELQTPQYVITERFRS